MSSPKVAVRSFRGEAAVVLSAGDYQAVFLPDLGMLGASLTWRGAELLSLHGGVAAYRGHASTGLPLLAPWANRLASRRFRVAGADVDLRRAPLRVDDNGLPIHGTMTARRGWKIENAASRRARARLHASFEYGADAGLYAAFPFRHTLEIEATVGVDGLRVETTLTPTGRRRVPVSFGWHPYFKTAGPRDRWTLRVPPRDHLELDARGIPTGEAIRKERETLALRDLALDDLYELGHDRRFVLAGGGRTVVVRFDGRYPFAQLYAPAGRRFVAIEPMTAPTNGLVTGAVTVVRPGERYTAAFSVSASG